MALEGHRDEVILDEMWSFIGRKDNPVWLWIALSRRNLQVLAFHVGGHVLDDAKVLWKQVPVPWHNLLTFTDGYAVYPQLFAACPHKHCATQKGEGETSELEGVNNALRHRVSYLVRRSCAFARSHFWLCARLLWTLFHWNKKQDKRYS